MKKKNKYEYIKVLQGNYSYGWEDLCTSVSVKEVREDRKTYRENCPEGSYRIISRRVLNEN